MNKAELIIARNLIAFLNTKLEHKSLEFTALAIDFVARSTNIKENLFVRDVCHVSVIKYDI